MMNWKKEKEKKLRTWYEAKYLAVVAVLCVSGCMPQSSAKPLDSEYWAAMETSVSIQPMKVEEAGILSSETTLSETEEETITETTIPQPETVKLEDGYIPPSIDNFIIDENADSFFADSVFIGDSVMQGFLYYVMQQEEGFLGNPEFLVSGSYSIRMALTPVSEDTIHPLYQGKQELIEDAVVKMGVKKVFLFFGLNDLGMSDVEQVYEIYLKFINKIKEKAPDVQVYVISTTYMRIGSEKQDLNNANIRALNQKMEDYSRISDVKYIEIADYLIDEEGGLRSDYCSDSYVHQTPASYAMWTQLLRCYASGGNILVSKEEPTSDMSSDNQEVKENESEIEETAPIEVER